MARDIRIKTRAQGGVTEILTMVSHPMETGQRKDKSGKKIPAHHINKLNIEVNGKLVASANLGAAVSKNPMVGVRVKGAKAGDKVKVSWNDNKNEAGSAEATV
jgi:sulfur-oxidizing protein SoxZ